MFNFSIQLFKTMRLVLFPSVHFDKGLHLLKRKIFHISTVARTYHLEIYKQVPIDTLIEILTSLLTPNSILISSLLLSSHPICLSDQTSKVLSFLTNTNRIARVCLEEMTRIEEVYFLMDLCTHMTYLKVNYINHMDIELFVRLILMKMMTNNNHQLRLLAFRVAAADDEMIQKLDNMINSEKLLLNYTIKRIDDNIYLQWT